MAFGNETYSATFFAGGTLDNLVVGMNQQFSYPITFTVFVNGNSTALTCQIPGNSGYVCTDTTHSVSVTAGQTSSVHVSQNFPDLAVHFRVRMH
jgi:hypothetical protein